MCRRAGDVGDFGVAEASEQRADAFPLSAEYERTSTAQRAQKNLQASIAPNIVERGPLLQWRVTNRAHQSA